MILQGESYEFGTVFQTVAFFIFVIPRLPSRVTLATLGTVFQTDFVVCWMLLVGSLLVGYRLLARCLLAILAINQTTKSQNNKTTKKTRIATFIFDGAFIAQE